MASPEPVCPCMSKGYSTGVARGHGGIMGSGWSMGPCFQGHSFLAIYFPSCVQLSS